MAADDDRFERRDVWLSLLVALTGALVLVFVVSSVIRGNLVASPLIYVAGAFAGLLLLLVGAGGVFRSLRAPRQAPYGDDEVPGRDGSDEE